MALESALLAAAVFGAASLSIGLTRDLTEIAAVWPVNAIVLATILQRDRSQWPHLLATAYLANACANLVMGNSWIIAIFCSAANVVEVLICAQFFARGVVSSADVGNSSFFLRLFAGAVVGAAASAIIATAAMSIQSSASPWIMLSSWIISDGLGLAIFVPACTVLLAGDMRAAWLGSHTPRIAALVWLGFLVGAGLIFGQATIDLLPAAPLLLLSLAFNLEFRRRCARRRHSLGLSRSAPLRLALAPSPTRGARRRPSICTTCRAFSH